jgi:hypothetical protein
VFWVVDANMASANLNSENDFSDGPDRSGGVRSSNGLMRLQEPLSPNAFFIELRTRMGRDACTMADVERAFFLYKRLMQSRLDMRRCLAVLTITSVSPLFCFMIPQPIRWIIFGGATVAELGLGALLFHKRRQWELRCYDYITWLRVVYRRSASQGT